MDENLYEVAKDVVITSGRPTISYLQRRLGVGYNKAATLMERMERDGVVTRPGRNGLREIAPKVPSQERNQT